MTDSAMTDSAVATPPSTYHAVYARWRAAPEAFWAEAAEAVHWYRRWDAVLDASRPPFYRWFPGAQVNTCYNALDRHVEGGRADQTALIYDSPVTGTVRTFTYRELRDEVARFAGVLAARGVGRGDRVIIYMPMVPETVIAMLACARIGAIHSVVFGGFASPELASRITDARPKVILTASCGIELDRVVPYKPLLDRAIELAAAKPECCIVLQRPQERATLVPGRDHDWAELAAGASPVDCVPVRPPIRSTSSTPRAPPAIPRASSATTAAISSPSPGACATSTASSPARCTGRRPTSAGRWAIRTSSTGRCSTGTPPCSTKESRSARRMRAPSGGSSRSTACAPSSPRRPRFARSSGTIPPASTSAATTSAVSARCFWPASAATPPRSPGPSSSSAFR